MTTEIDYPPHSYERFAQRPFYQKLDRELVSRAPVVQRALDLATGTGAIIQQLLYSGKLQPPFTVTGLDLSEDSLSIARSKFKEFQGSINFRNGNAEQLTDIADSSQQLVTICNSIHLMDPEKTFAEIYRVLELDGMVLINTAYAKGLAHPTRAAEMFWGRVVVLARKGLIEKYPNIENPKDLEKYTAGNYVDLALQAGFGFARVDIYRARMDQEDVAAICDYSEFANGACPGVKTEDSTKALVEASYLVMKRMREGYVERNWMFLELRKTTSQAA